MDSEGSWGSDASSDRRSRRLDLRPAHEIQIQAVNSKTKILTRYVGQSEQRYIIVRNGSRQEDRIERMNFSAGEIAIARFLLNGVALGFRSSVLSVQRMPETLLYLDWPEDVAEQAVRSAPRLPCCAAARVEIQGDVIQAALTDISETGCRVDLLGLNADAVQQGDELCVWAYLPGVATPPSVTAVVRRRQVPAKDRLILGLEFKEAQQELLSLTRAYLSAIE
ncbi:MAG: PilZ domain-containing protein [Ectothiorhodospiraceae bacterium]